MRDLLADKLKNLRAAYRVQEDEKRVWQDKAGYFSTVKKRYYGVVEIRRLDTTFARGGGGGIPEMGEAFVRLEKVDGTLGARHAPLNGYHKLPLWTVCND